eukprot:RCo024990
MGGDLDVDLSFGRLRVGDKGEKVGVSKRVALQKALATDRKMKRLKETDDPRYYTLLESQKWKSALAKAQGMKPPRTAPTLLRMSKWRRKRRKKSVERTKERFAKMREPQLRNKRLAKGLAKLEGMEKEEKKERMIARYGPRDGEDPGSGGGASGGKGHSSGGQGKKSTGGRRGGSGSKVVAKLDRSITETRAKVQREFQRDCKAKRMQKKMARGH